MRCLECHKWYPFNEWEGHCKKTNAVTSGDSTCKDMANKKPNMHKGVPKPIRTRKR